MSSNNDENLKDEIRGLALQNAVEFDGKTHDKVVLGKLVSSKPEYKRKIKEIMVDISNIVNDVNKMSKSEQKSELEKNYPHFSSMQKRDSPKTQNSTDMPTLPALEDAQKGNVVTRFPPEPNGYPHIGHAKAAIINEEYVNMYGGKKILRMDDTNPENERLEYYAAIKVGLEWLGIKYDIIKNTSDDIELLYNKALDMINAGKAFVCTCKRDNIGKNRRLMLVCKCNIKAEQDPEKNLDNWHKLFTKYKPGDAILRYRGDMKSPNTVMRDPVLFRIIDARHPLLGEKYRVWPNYDFTIAIEDSVDGVTHAFRSKEYELRNELYYSILDDLKMRKPTVLEFSRLELKRMPVSKRILKQLIEERKISWYDDPRIPTLESMRRRGIKPEAIRKFILSLGFTKSDTMAPFDALEAFNRKIIDPTSIRLYMVHDPKRLIVNNLPLQSVELDNHPANDKAGKRRLFIDENLLLAGDDAKRLFSVGSHARLMNLGNIKVIDVNEGNQSLLAEYIGDDIKTDYPKMQWIPQKNAHKIKIFIPKIPFKDDNSFDEKSLIELDVYTEPHYLELPEGEEIQFVRFGYCRKESQNQAIYTHK